MKVSLTEEIEANSAESPERETALAPVERETAMTSPMGFTPGTSGLVGEIDDADLRLPTLNIVQAVGPLSELFANQSGAIVYNKETIISPAPEQGKMSDPVNITILNARKFYEEWFDYGDERIPQTADTVEEVRAAGGTTHWQGDTKPSWRGVLEVGCLIEGDEGVPGLDSEFEGRYYGPAMWTLRSTAYKRAGSVIMTAGKLSLKHGLVHGKFQLCSKREKVGKNFVFVPILRQVGLHTPQFVDFVAGLTGR
jgi:hypothetical protein